MLLMSGGSEPEELPTVDEDEVERVIEDSTADTGESSQPSGDTIEEQVEADNRQVASVFGNAYGSDCDSGGNNDTQTNPNCRVEQSMVKFLGSFLIGGELPGL